MELIASAPPPADPRYLKNQSPVPEITMSRIARVTPTRRLCFLIPETTYSALDGGCVLGVPPSGGEVCRLDAIPPEGATPNSCGGGTVVSIPALLSISRRNSFNSIATSLID